MNAAPIGLSSRPPSQFWTSRTRPGVASGSRAINVAWIRLMSSTVMDAGSSARAIASSMALTLAATVRTLPLAARGSTNALARLRVLTW
jgi:hypothetical protein